MFERPKTRILVASLPFKYSFAIRLQQRFFKNDNPDCHFAAWAGLFLKDQIRFHPLMTFLQEKAYGVIPLRPDSIRPKLIYNVFKN